MPTAKPNGKEDSKYQTDQYFLIEEKRGFELSHKNKTNFLKLKKMKKREHMKKQDRAQVHLRIMSIDTLDLWNFHVGRK